MRFPVSNLMGMAMRLSVMMLLTTIGITLAATSPRGLDALVSIVGHKDTAHMGADKVDSVLIANSVCVSCAFWLVSSSALFFASQLS